MSRQPGRLILPALRWRPETGFGHEAAAIADALDVGVGGFILFGGTVESVRRLTSDLVRRAERPLLIASDLERGAGQQVGGLTEFPPPAALASLEDATVVRWAGAVTAQEARAVGINWVFAPVADLDILADNPIVQTRAFGSDPARVATYVRSWIEGCQGAGALACAKHFPGHGRTTVDSHITLPVVEAIVAGVDLLLYPKDPRRVREALQRALEGGSLSESRLDEALRRYEHALALATAPTPPVTRGPFETAAALADELLAQGMLRRSPPTLSGPVDLVVVDDDLGGPYPPGPSDYTERILGPELLGRYEGGSRVVLVFAEPRAWKGRSGLGPAARDALAAVAPGADLIVLFGHPRLLREIPSDAPVLLAWHRQRLMQEAVGRWIGRRLS
jgi:hypothetical protein